jgi:hypothetical protein
MILIIIIVLIVVMVMVMVMITKVKLLINSKEINTSTIKFEDFNLLADNLTRSISVYIPKDIIKYNLTRNITTSPIIYIGVFTRTITVDIPRNIIKFERQ